VSQPSQAKPGPRDHGVYLDPPDLGGALGVALGVDKVLYHKRTQFQEIHLVEAGRLGRVLLLDGIIQTCEFDEAGYHEMLVHVPMLTHLFPAKVLIIGGGDGGALREVLKHPGLQKVDLCEIDGEVIEVCKRYLPGLASGFDDPRVTVHIGGGVEFLAEADSVYDVILVDSSDPEGPALSLFGEEFYGLVKRALLPGGLAAALAESYHIYQDLIRDTFAVLDKLFDFTAYYLTQVPSYNSGIIGFALCTTGAFPLSPPEAGRVAELGPLRYYTGAVHRAAFALPRPALELLPPNVAALQENPFTSTRVQLPGL
jgi:spermidine synthase